MWIKRLWRRRHERCGVATSAVSNGPTDAVNLPIKTVKRVGHGLRNFNNDRLRLLLHYGTTWDAPGTTMRSGQLHVS